MSSAKRRQHIRYEIKLAATIEGSSSIRCMIQDFCSGGLFLLPLQNENVEALMLLQTVQVVFSVNPKYGYDDFKVEVEIMHIRPNGIGVRFLVKPEHAMEALKKEAQDTTNLSPSKRQDNQAGLSNQKKLETEFFNLLQKTLPAIIQSFYQQFETTLTERSETANNIEDANALIDAVSKFKIGKDTLVDTFCSITQPSCSLTLSSSSQSRTSDKTTPLALIDQTEFEDWLNLSVIIRNLDAYFETPLEQLQNKMAYLIGIDKYNIINPASPTKFCDRFHDSIVSLEDDRFVRDTLYALFEEIMLEFLAGVYNKMDAILTCQGAPDKITHTNDWLKINPGSGKEDTHYSEPEIYNDSSTMTTATGSSNDNLTLPSIAPSASKQKTKSIVEVANNLLHLLQGQIFPQQQSTPVEKDNVSAEYSAEEISTALTHLQQNTDKDSVALDDPTLLKKELEETLKTISKSDKQLSNTDQNNIEVYQRLFDILFNQLFAQENKPYLQRIHLAIINQAMKDPGFLESDSHPARNIVNQLSMLESAVVENKFIKNQHIRQTLDQLMEQISDKSLDDNSVFTAVDQQLNKITEAVNKTIVRNTHRVTEFYEGKQKLEKARLTVQEEINSRLSGKQIPKIIISLLEAGWQNLLVFAHLNNDNESFQSYLRVINNLNGWLSGSEDPNKEQAESTLKFIDEHLKTVCANTFLHNQILEELYYFLLKDSFLLGSDIIEMTNIEPLVIKQKKKKPNVRTNEIDQLEVGEWLTFLLDDELETLKLVWIGEIEDLYVFVKRNGDKRLELNRQELSELIGKGDAKRVESLDLPVMDRATNMMLHNMHEKLVYNAIHDPITLLLNRKEFIKQVKQELVKFDNAHHLLCNIEIQDFRIITSACGIEGGDALLKQLAESLESQLKQGELVARLDNKTFSVLLKNHPADTAYNVGKDIQSKLIDKHFDWEDKSFAIAVCIGVVPLTTEVSHDLNNVLQKTDFATLSAKNAGRNRIQVYKEDDESLKSQYNLHEWIGRINQVFDNERLFLRCQKIAAIDVSNGQYSHYEILLGIYDENGNVIAPDDFIPAVERCQRMSEVDRWVVQSSLTWVEQNRGTFEMLDGISINLSGESMNSEEFLTFLKQTLSDSKVPLEKITFEITETVAADSFVFVQNFIKEIKQFKCKFSLDDFGSGYSSYSYLKSLDVDYLKIDGIFVKDILNSNTDIAIVKSMNEIAHSLGLKTIAEYVENSEIHEQLKEIGVDYAQGYGIQKPILLNDLTDSFDILDDLF
jgi:diguanylate cyclase (GGDEF)-like protein